MQSDNENLLLLLKRLSDSGVNFTLIGGMAAIAHGSSMVTKDVDVCSPMIEANIARILSALRDLHPRHRMRPDLAVPDDPARLLHFKNLYVKTDLGTIDFLGDLPGVGSYEDAAKQSAHFDLGIVRCKVLNLDALIAAKRAAGRPKDLKAIRELEILKREQEGGWFDNTP